MHNPTLLHAGEHRNGRGAGHGDGFGGLPRDSGAASVTVITLTLASSELSAAAAFASDTFSMLLRRCMRCMSPLSCRLASAMMASATHNRFRWPHFRPCRQARR